MKLMSSRFNEIQEFLNKILWMSKSGNEITSNVVYSQLAFYEQGNTNPVFKSNYFSKWIDDYKNVSNIDVEYIRERPHFLWFENGKIKGNEVKLYIPIKEEYMDLDQFKIFNFLAKSNIEHQSKISSKVRNDNLVIRVNNLDDAGKVISFVYNNIDKNHLMKTNPFLPNIDGVGMAMDNNYSYNFTVAEVISELFNDLKRKKRLDLFNIDTFCEFCMQKSNIEADLDKKDIFSQIAINSNKNVAESSILKFFSNKILDDYDIKRKRIVDPKHYLEQAVKCTYQKYPQNVIPAIINYVQDGLNGVNAEAKYFTNDFNSREKLKKYVDPKNVLSIIEKSLNDYGKKVPSVIEDMVKLYVNVLKEKGIIFDKSGYLNSNEIFKLIVDAFEVTYKTYGMTQASFAIYNLLDGNDLKAFTNQNGNYRSKLKNLGNVDFKKVLIENVYYNGLDVTNNEMVFYAFLERINISRMNKKF